MKTTLVGLFFSVALSAAQICAAQIQPAPANSPQTANSPAPTPTPAPIFTMKPTKIQTGRTRDVTISVDRGNLKGYKLKPPAPGSGITYEPAEGRLTNNDTSLTFRASVDEDADLGPVTVEIAKDGGAEPQTFELEIAEFTPRRISRGPTPDDMSAVDAIWNVLPYKVTKANFGRRAADSFHAIEVFIGNNSGFDLQIVGVGFDTGFGARTTDKDGKPLKVLMDEKTGKPVLDEYGNKFVEAVDGNGNYVDENGKPIPAGNNGRTYRVLRKYQLATSDHRLVRGAIEMDRSYGSRALTMNLIGGFGTFFSGFIPFYRNANPKANFSTFSSIINGQLKEGFGLSAPDLTVNQLNRLENLVLHEGLTIPNNTQARTIVFFPRHVVGLDKGERKRIEEGDMRPLLDKLGELIIVGKPFISFSNRQVVASKGPQPPSQPGPPATPAAAAPTVGAPQLASPAPVGNAPGQPLTIPGSNLTGVTAVTIGGVPARITSSSNAQVTVEIPQNVVSGDIVVTTPGGSAKAGEFKAQPRIAGFKPSTDNAAGSTLVISGANLAEVTKVTFGTKETTQIVGAKTPNSITVIIPERAESGAITVESPNGKASSTDRFTARPVIDTITAEAGPGEEVVITGLNLENTKFVLFNQFSTKEIIGNPGPKEVKVKVPSSAAGVVLNGPITVITSDGSTVESGTGKTFKLIEKPTVSGMSAVGGQPTPTLSAAVGDPIEIHGTNLKTVKSVKFEGADAVTVFNPAATDTKITVTVPTGAKTGTIKVTTRGGEVQTGVLTVP